MASHEASAASRVWDDQNLVRLALSFCDVVDLTTMRVLSRENCGVASSDATWSPRTRELPLAATLHASGFLSSLGFDAHARLSKLWEMQNTEEDSLYDALAIEILLDENRLYDGVLNFLDTRFDCENISDAATRSWVLYNLYMMQDYSATCLTYFCTPSAADLLTIDASRLAVLCADVDRFGNNRIGIDFPEVLRVSAALVSRRENRLFPLTNRTRCSLHDNLRIDHNGDERYKYGRYFNAELTYVPVLDTEAGFRALSLDFRRDKEGFKFSGVALASYSLAAWPG